MSFGNGPRIVTDGLILNLDAADRNSYVSDSSTWNDLSGNGNSGSLVNGPTFSSANNGNLIFNGSTSQYISLGTFANQGTINRTYNIWFIVTTLSATLGRVLTFPADDTSADTPAFTLGIFSNGVLTGGIGGSPYNGYNFNIPYTLNTWVNISATVITKTVTFYKNGISLGSNTSTGTVSSNPIGYIGRYNANYGQYLTGQVANTQIYNRALSAAEIAQNYNALKSRFSL